MDFLLPRNLLNWRSSTWITFRYVVVGASLRLALPALLFATRLLAACSSIPTLTRPIAEPTTAAAPHWTYKGEAGPKHWGELDSTYSICSNGTRQSPIDLSNAAKADLPNIVFNYQPSQISILNNGHTVQVNYPSGSFIEVDGARYELAQFHYHAPGEHTLNGESFPAEIHLVHKNSEGKAALVIGILLTGNNRPVQPLNQRPLTEDSTP